MNASNQPKLSTIFESKTNIIFEGRLPLSEVTDFLDYGQNFILKPTTEFVACVSEFGVFQNIILERIGTDPTIYWIRAGKRRYQAAVMAELESIPVTIVENTGIAGEAITLLENHHRSNNGIAELEALMSIDEKTKEAPKSDKELAKALGIPVQTIQKIRPIGNLPDEIIRHLQKGKLAITTAQKLAKKSERIVEQVSNQIIENPNEKVTMKMVDNLGRVQQAAAMEKFDQMIDDQTKQLTAPDPELVANLIDFYMPDIQANAPNYFRGARKLVAHIIEKGIYYDGKEQ